MISGAFWQGTGQVATQLVSLVALAVLARLVSPAEFGLVGMATILTGLVARLGDLGLGSAVIQKKSLSDAQVSSVFWAVLTLGALSTLLAIVVSPIFARLMRQPELVALVSVAAPAFFISSLGATHRYLLLRDLHFRQLTMVELLAAVAYAASAIALAFAGFGAWSIVIGHLVQAVSASAAIWIISSWRPRRVLDRTGLRGLMSFGAKAWAAGLLGYSQESGDYFVIGRALGPTPLGFYTMAFNLANVPRTRLGSVVSMVAFTGFSRIQDDERRVGRGYLRVMRYTSLLSFPLLAGMMIVAPEFIRVVYGPGWSESVAPLRVLCAAALPSSLVAAMPALLLARNRPDLHLRLAVVSTVAFFVCVVIGARWGIVGVAVGLLVHATVFLFVTSHFVNAVVGLSMSDFVGSIIPAAVATAVMGCVVLLVRFGLAQFTSSQLVVLAGGVFLGAVAYVGALHVLHVPEIAEARRLLGRRSA